MEIKRDGVVVGRGEWGVAIPVDPGSHTIEATAPKKQPYKTTFEVKEEGAAQTVTVPALDDAPDSTPAVLANTPAPSATTITTPGASNGSPPPGGASVDTDTHRGSGQRTVGIVVGAVGIVGVAVGGIFALNAKSKYNDSLKSCPSDKNLCTPDGVSQRDDARSAGNVATVALGVGAVAIVAGAVLWLTAPKSDAAPANATTVRVRFDVAPTLGGGSAFLRGQW